jgi:pyruvate dehydrogenase E2 component (dihydrolipoamide acetyltransferase)
LASENERRPIAERVLYGVLLVKAVALALRDVPELNGAWTDNALERKEAVHVGVAISLRGGGLVAPAIHDTDKLTLTELMSKFRDLVQRARAGSLRSSEMSDPTITVTSLGETGAESVMGLIYPPQVALVGFGRLTQRVLPIEGGIGVRPSIVATLSADHRVVDGHRGSVFLAALERLLQEPERL